MYKIIENKTDGTNTFDVCMPASNGPDILIRTIDYTTATINEGGKTSYLLYDSEQNVIKPVFFYLEQPKIQKSLNYLKKQFYDLRYLYIYADIIDKDVKDFKYEDFVGLSQFLSGTIAGGSRFQFRLLSKRGYDSVLAMFSTYREYYRYLKVKNEILSESFTRFISINIRSVSRFKDNPYITEEEFARLMKAVEEEPNKEIRERAKLILKLEYYAGLRIGEVLGLTYEDVKFYTTNAGEVRTEIVIRNRLSDNLDQLAKGCMKIISRDNYKAGAYQTYWSGFQISMLPGSIKDEIDDYIDTYHPTHKKKHKEGYATTVADSVDTYKCAINKYIFLNNCGGRLTQSAWNKKLKEFFKKANIKLDSKTRNENLNHRLRHSLGVRLEKAGYPAPYIQRRLRHRNPDSMVVYTQPSTEDIAKLNEEMTEVLNDGLITVQKLCV